MREILLMALLLLKEHNRVITDTRGLEGDALVRSLTPYIVSAEYCWISRHVIEAIGEQLYCRQGWKNCICIEEISARWPHVFSIEQITCENYSIVSEWESGVKGCVFGDGCVSRVVGRRRDIWIGASAEGAERRKRVWGEQPADWYMMGVRMVSGSQILVIPWDSMRVGEWARVVASVVEKEEIIYVKKGWRCLLEGVFSGYFLLEEVNDVGYYGKIRVVEAEGRSLKPTLRSPRPPMTLPCVVLALEWEPALQKLVDVLSHSWRVRMYRGPTDLDVCDVLIVEDTSIFDWLWRLPSDSEVLVSMDCLNAPLPPRPTMAPTVEIRACGWTWKEIAKELLGAE
jgi:hypothetical protein